MKDNTNFENLLDSLQGQFDIEEPKKGHQARFIEKLKNASVNEEKQTKSNFWRPFLAIAASIVICLGTFQFINANQENIDLASVSPEMSEVQGFLIATIEDELKKLDAERSPITEHIIYEAERQLKSLEDDYTNLKIELKETGNDERVIRAMISNFQSRINILNNILDKIKDLKNQQYETENTL